MLVWPAKGERPRAGAKKKEEQSGGEEREEQVGPLFSGDARREE